MEIEDVINAVGNRFAAVVVAARRARQINAYFSQLGEGVAEHTPPQVPMSPDRAPKALSLALEEISQELVGYERTADGIK